MMNDVSLTFDVPDWAKFRAVDESGDFCVFAEKPFLLDEVPGEGIFETKGDFLLLAKQVSTVNWKESLEEIVTPVIN
jgi:hypothetical protein